MHGDTVKLNGTRFSPSTQFRASVLLLHSARI